jgi:hypothetical protein
LFHVTKQGLAPTARPAPEPEALAVFHEWADTRRRRSWHVAFGARYIAAVVLMAIGGVCISLARMVAPVPS